MSFSIAGKTAIVTGAANGVGLAIGRHFVSQGANVVFADMDEERLEEELGSSEIEQEHYRSFACDLRQKLSINNLLSMTIDSFERVDILVNASRQMVPSDPLNPKEDQVEALLNQNLMTSLRLTQAISKRMIKQAEDQEEGVVGSIINLSSIAARRANPDLLGYSVSTAALDQMTRSMAVALAPSRIRVNAVAFGSVMSSSLQQQLKEHDEYRSDIIEHTPLGRIAGPGEVSDAVQYLASDASSFVTGQIITVDGGRTLIDPANSPAH
ncbi:SDR family NAD(P)-dependent oxidoreductase [Octadecabacter ascidiaceicola]|uniref:3-oxoacyl-[acyl-carrier-protein] reductase FabG n=1 Tax=Octadecabacter ascidiaceicola TaxID=1655543 RepID=A0A238KL01_9RHOB|nr:SDR family oxidoreductase [Octadecabacter ascidiaceicola]SMX43380.1 3-oxoacyl-[acyl-carrier-protein] reductase FabG [Octadecabacter ascidiaceicola]